MSIKAEPNRKLVKEKKVQVFGSALIDRFRIHERIKEEQQKKASDQLQELYKTAQSLLWSHYKLRNMTVHKKAIHIILDTDFFHYHQLEKTVLFISETFEQLAEHDYFGLISLGDSQFSMDLESKGSNRRLKMEMLEQLQNSIEDVIMQQREQDLKNTIIQSIQALDNLNLPDINYRGRVFEGMGRWLICFLGSLKGVSDLNVQSINTSPNVNIIIILLTDEHISKYQRNRLKELVRSTR